MKFKNILLSLLALISLSFSSPLTGQNILSPANQATQTVQDTSVVPIQPIPTTDITNASSVALTLVTESGKNRLKAEEIKKYTDRVDTLLSVVNEFYGDIFVDSLELLSNRELNNLQMKAQLYIGQIDNMHRELSQRSQKSEDVVAQLNKEVKRWQLTLEKAPENETSESLVERVNGTIFIIDSVRTIIQKDVEQLLTQLDRLSQKNNNLRSLQDKIVELNKLSGQALFKRDSPNFFNALSELNDSTLIQTQIQNIRKSVRSDNVIFNSQFKAPLIILGFFFILLLIFQLWFKKNYLRAISTKKFDLTDVSLTLINNPIPVVIFITTFLIRFVFSDLPETYKMLNATLLILAMLIITIKVYESYIKSWAKWLIALFIVSILYGFLFFGINIVQRIFLLCYSIAAFVYFLLFILRKPKENVIKREFFHNLYVIVFRIIVFLQFIAIISNLVGASALAEFLSISTVHIVVIALAIHMSSLVADTLIFLILASRTLQTANVFRDNISIIHKRIMRLANIFLWGFFAVNTLETLRLKDTFFEWGSHVLSDGWKVGDASISLGSILIFILVIWLSITISKIITAILDKDVFSRVRTAKGIPSTIIMLVKIVLISAGFFLAAAAAGMELTNLSIIIGAFSVGIGFGLQNIFNNLVSGLILAFERPIKVGDVVQVGELMGVVLVIGFRASTIRSFDGAEVIVPNGNLISNEMINWTLSDSNRRMDLRIGVKYGTDPELVLDIIEKVAAEHEKVSKDPPPKGYFIGFGDSSLDFRLLAWTDIEGRLVVESELNVAVNSKLKEAGIEIPFPQRDLHLRSDFRQKEGDPPQVL